MTKTITNSEKQTFALGKKLAGQLQGGEAIGLIGNLGAGKTALIKGLASGLGILKTITSPTFVLMKIYKINSKIKNQNAKLQCKIQNLVHVDAYRLKSGQDLIDIGLKDWLNRPNTITVVEWANQAKNILPKTAIIIKIKLGLKPNQRIFQIN